jgi:uncharacterized protein
MLAAWSQLRDIDRLADGQVDVEFTIPLTELSRLPPQPAGSGEAVRGRVRFGREEGFAVAALELEGTVTLQCQRCLKPLRHRVEAQTDIALVASEADAARAPPQFEPVRAQDGRVRVRDLVEEELLLALPIAALHSNLEECEMGKGDVPAAPEMHKPFERLGELLKR